MVDLIYLHHSVLIRYHFPALAVSPKSTGSVIMDYKGVRIKVVVLEKYIQSTLIVINNNILRYRTLHYVGSLN